MKKTFLTFAAAAAALGCAAQVQLSDADIFRLAPAQLAGNAPAQVRLKGAPAGEATVDMLVRFDDASALDEVLANGGVIVDRLTEHAAIVNVKTSDAVKVAASKGLTRASLSRPVKLSNNNARVASGVDKVQAGTDLPAAVTGKGVVVGLFDSGVDPNHINFRGADGASRVRKVWYYAGASASATEYGDDATALERFESDNAMESHGTHVLGIITGSFSDPSAAVDYHGMAPEADIAIACGDGYNAQILGGIKKIAQYAKEQGKPCVINISFGDNVGPHDGSDDFTYTINEIAQENDAVITLAAGNERDEPISFIKTFTEDDTQLLTLILPSDMLKSNGALYQGIGNIQVWGSDATPFEVSLDIINRSTPDAPRYTLEIPEGKGTYAVNGQGYKSYLENYQRYNLLTDQAVFNSIYSNSYMGGVRQVDPYNNCYYADMNVYLYGVSQSLVNSNFVRLTIKGSAGQRVFVSCDGYYVNFGDKRIPGMEKFTGAGTNSNMASGKHTLSVGSYVTANITSSGYQSQTLGAPSYFSSFGETLDGRIMPDVCAPGQVIISSRNSELSIYNGSYPVVYNYTDPANRTTYYWTTCAGTSQAAPHMAGVAALWRSLAPNLTYDQIYDIARSTAAEPEVEGLGWGHGKVDAYAGVKYILESNGIVENVYEALSEKIMVTSVGAGNYEVLAPGADSVAVSLVNVAGQTVRTLSAAGDCLTVSTEGLLPGIYLLSAKASTGVTTLKIAVN